MKKVFSSLFGKYMLIFVSVLLLTNIVASAVAVILISNGQLPFGADFSKASKIPILFAFRMGLMSMVIGTLFIFFATKVVVKPIKDLSEAAKQIADGDFNVKLTMSRKGHDEISDLTDSFNHMIYELSRNEYLHKDFVSNVSHEFKTPISAIVGYAELLSAPTLSNEKRIEYAEVISRQSIRLAKLSSDLLRLSELENEQSSINQDSFLLDEQIREAVLILQNEWEQKNINMDINLEQVHFTGDKALMYQVWFNLIGNAIRYTNCGGEIIVSLHQSVGKTIVKIKDNGIGMAKEQQERIFERFYRAEESRTTGGTGLGLPIAKRIVTLHCGTLMVNSEINNGTEVITEFQK